jgi:DNA mismatch endonuclease (patch repair protein)
MRANKSSGTGPERIMDVVLRAAVGATHRNYGRNSRYLPGRPDFEFAMAVLFVDGCYWHSCPAHGSRPRTNPRFWLRKFARNRRRDEENNRALVAMRYTVYRVWECRVRADARRVAETVARGLREGRRARVIRFAPWRGRRR